MPKTSAHEVLKDCKQILAAVHETCPITADVAAFPVQGDHATISSAHQLVRPGRRLYISRGNSALQHVHNLGNLPGGHPPRTTINYLLQSGAHVSEAAWLAEQLARSASNPEVLIVAPKHHLPRVYMAVLSELIAHMKIRRIDDYAKLPRIIPCISPAAAPESAEAESAQLIAHERTNGTMVNHEQLIRYLDVIGLKK